MTAAVAWRDGHVANPEQSATRLATLLSNIAYGLYILTNILTVCAVKLGTGGLPFRMWTLLAAGGLLVVADPQAVGRAFRHTAKLLIVISAAAALGVIVSAIAHAPMVSVGRMLVEAHAQALVFIVITYALMLRFGIPRVLLGLLIAYAITTAFAIGQALHIGGAWTLRERIASISGDSIFKIIGYDPRQRPMGMSYTPVIFATQTCLVLAAWFYIRLSKGAFRSRGLDWTVIGVTILLLASSVITGNRSPILGMGLFLVVYVLMRQPKLIGLLLPAALLMAGVVAFNADRLGDSGLRVARSNSSSENRGTLRAYGYYLIARRPIGYGLTFDSTTKWPVFYQQSIYMPNPSSIRNWALHNYYLNMLTKYGLLILFLLPWILPYRREQLILWLPFLPYLVHILYHNDGPLQGDTLGPGLFAAGILLMHRKDLFRAEPAKTRPVPWRRAFANAEPLTS